MYLRLEMLRLEALLLTRRLAMTSAATWDSMFVGVMLVIALIFVVWNLAAWRRDGLPV
jgi:hypothetical protein